MEKTVNIQTSRFGNIIVDESDIYTFPEPILGFSGLKQYFIINNPKGGPFKWLQSLESPNLAFVVCDPLVFKPEYQIQIKKEDIAAIKLENIEDSIVFVMMVIPKDPLLMTANLQAPLIFNKKEKLAKQLVLIDSEYEPEYRVFKQTNK
ncbi:MAG: flagellar assembly protein FliW [Desulfobacterales bacterium]|nr:flagellar assembly protein FliW [Desulfobacterales bacterium]